MSIEQLAIGYLDALIVAKKTPKETYTVVKN